MADGARRFSRPVLRRLRRFYSRSRGRTGPSRLVKDSAATAKTGDSATRIALSLIAAFALARLIFDLTFGLGYDESYTVVLSRQLALSYFDHPPLHQWIAHFSALAFGEGVAIRLPFVALFAATGWLMFALTRHLFGARAGLVALVALNLSGFFFASAGGWVVPDGPLLFGLAGAALALVPLLFEKPSPRAVWGLWLAVGVCLGLAGLSKYSAALFAFSVVAFLFVSPRQRHWLRHPAPYVAALITLAMIAPVIVWNWEHHWLSLAFQSERATKETALRPWQVGAQLLGEIALLTPWIFAALAGALVAALRKGFGDERRLFLLCLALPPIVLFTLTPLWGARGLPHWPMPGWFFVYPLLGAWLDEPWAGRRNLKRWALASAGLLGAIAVLADLQVTTGWATRLFPLPEGVADPTLEMLDWSGLRATPLPQGTAFVVATKWVEAGKIALALGPQPPVLVFSGDPRGFGLSEDSADFVGRDGVIIVPEGRLAATQAKLANYFASFDPPQTMVLRRGGENAITLTLIQAHGLTHAYPLPYPR
ncbi:MAG: glycosyltransferase family 39 protein [Bradyrhizobium sp.]|nr:MAG: glycosyltransferase family 39 protein [Bradyrhizobium sp.]